MTENLKGALLKRDAERRARRKQAVSERIPANPLRNDPLPHLSLVSHEPSSLRAAERQIHKLDPQHLAEIAASIATLGFFDPVLIDTERWILDGVSRVEAAKQLGLATIPCIVAEFTSQEQRELLRLGLNVLSEKASYDIASLQAILQDLIVAGAPIEVTGIDSVFIDSILISDDGDDPDPAELVPKPEAIAVSRSGDVFRCGNHLVRCGDARDPSGLRDLFGSQQARLTLTDIPYNVAIAGHVTGGNHREFAMASGEMSEVEFACFNDEWMAQAADYLVDGGLLATFIDWRGLNSVTDAARRLGLTQLNLIVWGKTNAGMGSLYRSQHELLPLFKKGRIAHRNNVALGKKGRWRTNLWTYAGASTVGSDARQGLAYHPTVKPVAMLKDALLDVTDRDEIVFDPFLGSGSTLIACEQTGRCCIGIEIDPIYVDLIIRRFESTTNTQAVHRDSGETFETLSNRRIHETISDRSANGAERPAGRSRPARRA